MEDHQPAVQVAVLACEGGARVKCVGGLVESGLVRKKNSKIIIVKVFSIIIGLQRTQKKKELGTAIVLYIVAAQ